MPKDSMRPALIGIGGAGNGIDRRKHETIVVMCSSSSRCIGIDGFGDD
jgi:lipoprotein signal peptidase